MIDELKLARAQRAKLGKIDGQMRTDAKRLLLQCSDKQIDRTQLKSSLSGMQSKALAESIAVLRPAQKEMFERLRGPQPRFRKQGLQLGMKPAQSKPLP